MIKKYFPKILKVLSLILTAIFFTAILTWPLITKLSTYYSDGGDYSLTGWLLWYNYLSITTGRIFNQFAYFNSYQFYPFPLTLAYSEHLLFPSIFFSFIYSFVQKLVLSVNLASFLTFILSFLSSFFVTKYFTKNFYSSIVAAIVYTFNPLTFSHFPGHFQLMNKYFLPLIFLFAFKFFLKPNFKDALLLGLFFSLNALSVVYYEMLTLSILPFIFLPFAIISCKKKNYKYFFKLVKTSVIFFIFVPFILYINIPYLNFSSKESVKRSLGETIFFSAKPTDFISALPHNLIYGNFVKKVVYRGSPDGKLIYPEHTLFLNIIPFLLFVLGVLYLRRIKKNYLLSDTLLIFSVTTLLLSFGPIFQDTYLPYFYINNLFHIFDGLRAPSRFLFLFYVPFSILVGYGMLFILNKSAKFKFFVITVIIFLVVLENINITSYEGTSNILNESLPFKQKYINLKFLENQSTVHVPTYGSNPEKAIVYLNIDTLTKEKMLNGYSGYFPQDWAILLNEIDDNFNLSTIKKLSSIGIHYVIFHKDQLPDEYLENITDITKPYQNIKSYEDNDLLIINLDNKNLKPSLCNLINDIDINITNYAKNHGLNFNSHYNIILKNKSDCYLPSILNDRYLDINLVVNKKNIHQTIKLPIIIEPFQEFIVR